MQRYAAGLLDAMDRLLDEKPGISVTVLSPRLTGGCGPAVAESRSSRSRPFPGKSLGATGPAASVAWKDAVFCTGNSSPLISLVRRRSLVVTIHDLSYSYFPDAYSRPFRLWYYTIIPLAMKRATAILTVSDSERRSIVEHFPVAAPRIHAIANGGWPDERMGRRSAMWTVRTATFSMSAP